MGKGPLDKLSQYRWSAAAVVAMLLVPANFVLAVRSGLPLWNEDEGLFPQSVGLLLGFAAISMYITLKRPRLLVGKLLVVVCLGELARQLTSSYGYVGLISHPGSLPGAAFSSWLSLALFAYPGYVALQIWIPLLFPDGRPPARWLRPVAWSGFAPILSTIVVGALLWNRRGPELFAGPNPDNPFPPLVAFLDRWTITFVITWVPWLALASIVLRYVRGDATTRRQLRWFAIAAVTIANAALGDVISEPRWLRLVNSLPWVPAAIAVAVVRERLFEIDVVIRQSIVYGVLIAGVFALYTAVVGGASAFLNVTGIGPSLVATAIVAVLFQPARERLQRFAERLVYGGRRDPHQAVGQLGEHLRTAVGGDDALGGIAQTVAEAMRVPYVRIDLTGPEAATGESGEPAPSAERVTVPLIHRNETVGDLTVGLRAGERTLERVDQRVLDDLAPMVAAAAHSVALTAEVRRSRERLVAAREDERRRLRRDLHDGLGPTLAGMAMEIQAARNLLAVDHTAAADVLDDVESRARGAIGEVRRVVYGLRPPVLDQLGLVRALEEHAGSLSGPVGDDTLSVTVDASGSLDELPAATEVAAYLIALEALTNVARHSGARHCRIRLSADDVLEVEVSDDGRGPEEDLRAGVGLSSMRERAEELGGSLSVHAVRGEGVRVAARLPVVA